VAEPIPALPGSVGKRALRTASETTGINNKSELPVAPAKAATAPEPNKNKGSPHSTIGDGTCQVKLSRSAAGRKTIVTRSETRKTSPDLKYVSVCPKCKFNVLVDFAKYQSTKLSNMFCDQCSAFPAGCRTLRKIGLVDDNSQPKGVNPIKPHPRAPVEGKPLSPKPKPEGKPNGKTAPEGKPNKQTKPEGKPVTKPKPEEKPALKAPEPIKGAAKRGGRGSATTTKIEGKQSQPSSPKQARSTTPEGKRECTSPHQPKRFVTLCNYCECNIICEQNVYDSIPKHKRVCQHCATDKYKPTGRLTFAPLGPFVPKQKSPPRTPSPTPKADLDETNKLVDALIAKIKRHEPIPNLNECTNSPARVVGPPVNSEQILTEIIMRTAPITSKDTLSEVSTTTAGQSSSTQMSSHTPTTTSTCTPTPTSNVSSTHPLTADSQDEVEIVIQGGGDDVIPDPEGPNGPSGPPDDGDDDDWDDDLDPDDQELLNFLSASYKCTCYRKTGVWIYNLLLILVVLSLFILSGMHAHIGGCNAWVIVPLLLTGVIIGHATWALAIRPKSPEPDRPEWWPILVMLIAFPLVVYHYYLDVHGDFFWDHMMFLREHYADVQAAYYTCFVQSVSITVLFLIAYDRGFTRMCFQCSARRVITDCHVISPEMFAYAYERSMHIPKDVKHLKQLEVMLSSWCKRVKCDAANPHRWSEFKCCDQIIKVTTAVAQHHEYEAKWSSYLLTWLHWTLQSHKFATTGDLGLGPGLPGR